LNVSMVNPSNGRNLGISVILVGNVNPRNK
jgi:hypothetical protein